MTDTDGNMEKPKLGIGAIVSHPMFGKGRIMDYEGNAYIMVFKGGETKKVSFNYDELDPVGDAGNPETDLVKQAVREVLGDMGWLEVDIEMASRWVGGTLEMQPGKVDTQSKEIPIEVFFKKIIGVREKLRVLEQKINNHPSLSAEEKLELEGYITRSYGSLTSFNVLFSSKSGQFRGSGRSSDED